MRPFVALAAGLFALCTLSMPVAADWSSFHNDEQNNGFVQSSNYEVYTDVWWTGKLTPATQSDTTPVLDSKSSIAIITSWDKKVRAFDQESGAELWNQTLGAKIQGTPVIDNGRVFVVDTTGTMNAYNVEKGTLLGTVSVGATYASPAVHEGKIFIGNEAGEMKAYDTDTLTLLWKFTDGPMGTLPPKTTGTAPNLSTNCDPADVKIPAGQIRGAPAIAYGKVFFGSLNHYVYAVDEFGNPDKTTNPQWTFKTLDAVFASPTVSHDVVYIGSYDQRFYALDATPSGAGPYIANSVLCGAFTQSNPLWNYCVPPAISGGGDSKIQSTAAVDGPEGGTVTRVIFGSNNGNVTSLKISTLAARGVRNCDIQTENDKAQEWTFNTQGAVKSSPAVANGIVVVGSDDGHVYWLGASDGKLKKGGDFKPSGTAPIKSNPAIDGKRAFVTSFEGDIYMFGPKVPPRPDLAAIGISYANNQVRVTINNRGDGAAGNSTVRVQSDGALLVDIKVPALAAGATINVTGEASLATGLHSLKAIVDNNNEVKEAKESNNVAVVPITVAPPVPAPPPIPAGSTGAGASSGAKKKLVGPEPIVILAALAAVVVALRRRN